MRTADQKKSREEDMVEIVPNPFLKNAAGRKKCKTKKRKGRSNALTTGLEQACAYYGAQAMNVINEVGQPTLMVVKLPKRGRECDYLLFSSFLDTLSPEEFERFRSSVVAQLLAISV